jgi:3-phosphoshikimate 1-carboxyvinyltransferase
MRQFGVDAAVTAGEFRAPPTAYRPPEPFVEIVGDWSSAAFVSATAAICGGDIELTGLEFDSPQADRRLVDVLRDYGATVDRTTTGVRVRGNDRRPLDVDLRDAPDLAPLVGALGCVATGTTRVRGAAHLRLKESDRIATVVAAARALGCEAHELPDGFEIVGPAKHGGLVDTHHDHRIAMAFAVAGLAIPGVVIDDPACVAKSYPGFWDALLGLLGG